MLQQYRVVVERQFRSDGTTHPVEWRVQHEQKTEPTIVGTSVHGEFVDPEDGVGWIKFDVHTHLTNQGLTPADASRITWWLFENLLIQP